MRSLVTYRPYRPAPANFDRWFDSAFQNSGHPSYAATTPIVDVQEKADAYHLEAELPGLTEKDFTVNVEHNLLTISSQQEHSDEREENGYVTASGAPALSGARSPCRRMSTPTRSAPPSRTAC